MRLVFALLSVLLLTCQSQAALTYDLFFRTSLGEQGVFNVNAGSVFGASVILRETVTGATPSLIAATNVNFFAVDIASTGSDGAFQNFLVDSTGGLPTAANDANTIGFSAFGAGFGQPGKTSTVTGAGMREVVLGSVDLVAPTAGATEFSLLRSSTASPTGWLTAFNPSGSLVTAANNSGGGVVFSGTTLNVTAVPEPGSMAVLGVAGCGALVRFRKRFGRKVASA